MNGAVQGDAMTTARMPEPNASSVRFFEVQPVTPDGASCPNSNTPDRFSASTKNRIASALTTAGDCSWKPQPSSSPAARSKASAAPSATNVSTTPAANAPASCRSVGRVSLCVAKPSTFNVSTGKTQGIRLRMRPPTSADTTASASVRPSPPAIGAGARLSAGAAAGAGFAPAATLPASGDVDRRRLRGAETAGRGHDARDAIQRTRERGRDRQAHAHTRRRRASRAAARTARSGPAQTERSGSRPDRSRPRAARASAQSCRRGLPRSTAIPRAAAAARRARRQWRRPSAGRAARHSARAARASGPRPRECRSPCTRAIPRAPRAPPCRRSVSVRGAFNWTRCSTSPS